MKRVTTNLQMCHIRSQQPTEDARDRANSNATSQHEHRSNDDGCDQDRHLLVADARRLKHLLVGGRDAGREDAVALVSRRDGVQARGERVETATFAVPSADRKPKPRILAPSLSVTVPVGVPPAPAELWP